LSTYLPKSTSFVPAGTYLGVKLLRVELGANLTFSHICLGPNDEPNSILLTTQLLPSLAWRSRNHDKQRGEDDGSRSADVAFGNVHRGPNGCLGEQGCDGTNVGGTPDILHREVARAEAILGNDSKIITIQGGSATCTRDSSSRRGM
jgi:hypothetical protein